MSALAAALFDSTALANGEEYLALRALGMSPKDLASESNRARVVRMAFILQMADRVRLLCHELGINASEHSILSIAATLKVDASAEFPKGNPLSPSDRQIAEELVFRWMDAERPGRDAATLRAEAKRRVAFGERGRTVCHWIGENIFGFGR
jgi:hypothetical protein